MMKAGSTILVIGATGAIGRHVIKSLLADDVNKWKIHALTRNPMSDKARDLKQMNPDRIRLVQGNTNDITSIKDALENVQGIFVNTDFDSSGIQETQQGIKILEAAKWKNVEYAIYLSLDYATELSLNFVNVPRFDAKGAVEKTIKTRRSGGDSWFQSHCAVLTVVPYMENFMDKLKPSYENGKYRFQLPLKDKVFPLIALDDVGWFAAYMFANQALFRGKTLLAAGEAITGPDIAAQFAEVCGSPAEFIDIESTGSEELDKQFEFIRDYGMSRDYDYLRGMHSELKTFKKWLEEIGCKSLLDG
jgi:uncharacterized protein YbjT (DUF2867 family)